MLLLQYSKTSLTRTRLTQTLGLHGRSFTVCYYLSTVTVNQQGKN